ncbi:MAG: PIN/TRAM domain-containing protein [Candidatus Dormibacteria bacterium]
MRTGRHQVATVRRARVLARLLGAAVGILGGIFYGLFIISTSGLFNHNTSLALASLLAAGVAGAAAFALAAPLLTVDPFLWLQDSIDGATPGELLGASIGLLVALAVSALLAVLLGSLPWGLGFAISTMLACVLVYVGVRAGTRRRQVLDDVIAALPLRTGGASAAPGPASQDGTPIVLDTSALIDGRVADVARTGFIQGRLLLADFVLEELQKVADSGDPVRRQRGRRGLALADDLRRSEDVVCELVEVAFPGTPDVDARLVKLARLRGAALLTVDYNLNRLAQAEGLRVLNLNDLSGALKPPATAGEVLKVALIREGREPGQGVGYLDDGTMVVVEGGRRHLESTIDAVVTSVLQTSSGRMIFATAPSTPEESAAAPGTSTNTGKVPRGRGQRAVRG